MLVWITTDKAWITSRPIVLVAWYETQAQGRGVRRERAEADTEGSGKYLIGTLSDVTVRISREFNVLCSFSCVRGRRTGGRSR